MTHHRRDRIYTRARREWEVRKADEVFDIVVDLTDAARREIKPVKDQETKEAE